MCTMCHHCGAELASKDENMKPDNGICLNLNTRVSERPCRFCGARQEQENVNWDTPSPSTCTTPLISPTISLSSTDTCVSRSSDFSVDVNSIYSNREEGGVDGGMEGVNHKSHGQSHISTGNNMQLSFEYHDDDCFVRDVEITQGDNGQKEKDNRDKNSSILLDEETEYPIGDELDIQTWEPPEPQDGMDDSISYNDDDDDEDADGMKWCEPTSLNGFKDEVCGNYRFKEAKQRAMEEVINGKFKGLVSQLLRSIGVSNSGEDGESWVDIVTSLSWEAASFLKPYASDGKAMDPDGCLKVKCIATGTRSQSQMVKGLVFKKHAAHKRMPTRYKNPRLLLIKGMLGLPSSRLCSFDSMEQEKWYLKSIFELIEMCNPNVILVEKTVSRDIQESILAKGMTLVLDMKLHRLERVSHCTGSPILSCEDLNGLKLKQCDYIHFEKYVEEHAGLAEEGKKHKKTLMFIEGCPTRLGCTILLKGAHSEELKRIKCVIRCAVVMAYHLILETSFLVDQSAMFSTIPSAKVSDLFQPDQHYENSLSCKSGISSPKDLASESLSFTTDISISNGTHEGRSDRINSELEGHSSFSYEPYNPAIFSGFSSLSSSLKKVMGDSFPFVSSAPYQSLSEYFGFNRKEPNGQKMKAVSVSEALQADDNCMIEVRSCSDEEKSINDGHSQSLSGRPADYPQMRKDIYGSDDQIQNKDGINSVLDSQSILVLMSSRNASRGTMCEQSHFSHIMFYKNFDVPLGKFLRDNLLEQRRSCNTCGEFPEAHIYYYAHRNKQLTIQVKRLPKERCLPGEVEGKLWMWSRCGKCKAGNGHANCTKRVLISTAARSLSFGKFLELSLSKYSSSTRKSRCGHSPDRDFFYFFGLGHMVAMLRYSFVPTYTVAMPPQKLEFSNTIKQACLLKETENVYMKGMLLFSEVSNYLRMIKAQLCDSALNLGGSIVEFSRVEEMLKQERYEFEVNLKNAVAENGKSHKAAYKLLRLNRLLWELLIESCIWDRRFYSLLSHQDRRVENGIAMRVLQEGFLSKVEDSAGKTIENKNTLGDCKVNGNSTREPPLNTSAEANDNNSPVKENVISAPVKCQDQDDVFDKLNATKKLEMCARDSLNPKRDDQELSQGPDFSTHCLSGDGDFMADNSALSDHPQVNGNILNHTHVVCINPNADSKPQTTYSSSNLPSLCLPNSNEWFWNPFSIIRHVAIGDIQKQFLPKFECISSYTSQYLPTAYQLITEEGKRLHLPLKTDDHIVSDYESEISSIIACALTLLEDIPVEAEFLDEEYRREFGMSSKTTESSHGSSTSQHMYSSSSSDSDSIHSAGSISSEETNNSRASENHSIEVPLRFSKPSGKEKYSVTCQYVNQFRELRNWCCSSELDYIASLSRCRSWDAKGGKSKSVFAKTLDDRFIIKEIKKTEFDSFLGFAPQYFKYMKESFESGSQTCLAKVLGIYQVTKQTKHAKEVKHDLMVMENLTYNRKISRQYDLKGALYARYNAATDSPGDVLLDQNFVNDMNSSPLYVSNKAKRHLQRAVWNDTTFLNSINVMDYSLLVGVDSERRELMCGIIDYLRQYTWDKHLETWMKSSLVPKNFLPTIISPKEYKKRFRKFMSTHFLSVPDNWCSQNTADPSKCCGSGDDDSIYQNPEHKGG